MKNYSRQNSVIKNLLQWTLKIIIKHLQMNKISELLNFLGVDMPLKI